MVSTLIQSAKTGWIAFTEGPQAALSHALYTSSSWAGIQTIEHVKWLGSYIGHKAAKTPDWIIDTLTGKEHAETPQDLDSSTCPEADTYYAKIIDASSSVAGVADKAYQYVLTTIAPNAEKANFGLAEVIGPATFCGITGFMAISQAIKGAEQLKKLVFKDEGTGFEESGNLQVSDYRPYKPATLAYETFMHFLASGALGYATYIVATPLNERFIEAGVSQSYESIAALAIICPVVISYAYSYFSRLRGSSVKDRVNELEQKEKQKQDIALQKLSKKKNQFSLMAVDEKGIKRKVLDVNNAKNISLTFNSYYCSGTPSASASAKGTQSPVGNSFQNTLGGLYPTKPEEVAKSEAASAA